MTKSKKPGLIARLLARLPKLWETTEYEEYPEWRSCSPSDLKRISQRLIRLSEAYQEQFRHGSAMDIPLRHKFYNHALQTEKRRHSSGLDIEMAATQLSPAEIDVLMRALLAQLVQLEAIGYVHGSIRPDSLTIHKDYAIWSISLGHFHSGRFIDESVEKENLVESPWMSPENWRRLHYPNFSANTDSSDVFSAGCLYYTLLTGEEPSAFPGGGTPASAIGRLLPAFPGQLQGFRASFIRWLQAPVAADRPRAADALAVLSSAHDAGLTTASPLPCLDGSTRQAGGLSILRSAVTPEHLANQYLAFSDDGVLLLREHHLLWDPQQLDGVLFDIQREQRIRILDRMKTVCQHSQSWHATNPFICVNSLYTASQTPLTTAPLLGHKIVLLSQLRDLNDSIFLLDARMTEVLAAVQVLHDDGYLLGCFSEANFYVELRSHGAVVHMADLSGAASCSNLPPPCDYVPDPKELLLLSPEMTQYISSGARTSYFDTQLWISPASDIFTLGLLYHLILSGEYPQLIVPSYGTFSNALCHDGQPASAFCLSPKIDHQHSRLILRMLALEPIERPARCEDVLNSILDFYTA